MDLTIVISSGSRAAFQNSQKATVIHHISWPLCLSRAIWSFITLFVALASGGHTEKAF